MDPKVRLVRLFLASPGDVPEERQAVRAVVSSINSILRDEPLRIEVVGWEGTTPGDGRPQELINSDLNQCDLFVGVMWQRWGSPSGTHSSGFFEEFEHAADRHRRTQRPERWIFFKMVPSDRAGDPGNQLKQVLAFKDSLIRSQDLLFKEFSDVADFTEQLRTILTRHAVGLLKGSSAGDTLRNPDQDSTPTMIARAPDTHEPEVKIEATIPDMEHLWKATENPAALAKVSEVAAVRGLLACYTILSLRRSMPVEPRHLHIAYLHRTSIEVAGPAGYVVIQSLLKHGSNAAGWYWFQSPKPDALVALLSMFTEDPDQDVRAGAIATLLEVAPRPSRRVVLGEVMSAGHEAEPLQLLIIRHFEVSGVPADLDLWEGATPGTRTQSVEKACARAAIAITARNQPPVVAFNQLLRSHVYDWAEQPDTCRLFERVDEEAIRSALTHPATSIRARAFEELARRKALAREDVLAGLSDSDPRVWEAAMLGGRSLSASDLANLEKSHLSGERFDALEIQRRTRLKEIFFESLPLEDLLGRLEWVGPDGPTAYRTAGLHHFEAFESRVRQDLNSNFEGLRLRWVDSLRAQFGDAVDPLIASWRKLDPYIRENFTAAALRVLAARGRPEDAIYGRRFANSTTEDLSESAIALLAAHGDRSDAPLIRARMEKSWSDSRASAASALLAVSRNDVAVALEIFSDTHAPSAELARPILAGADDSILIPGLLPLLTAERSDTRDRAVRLLIARLSRERLEQVLVEYLTKPYYYYDVVSALDRALYFPGSRPG